MDEFAGQISYLGIENLRELKTEGLTIPGGNVAPFVYVLRPETLKVRIQASKA